MHHAMQRAGFSSEGLGIDEIKLAQLSAFVELHIEQGRRLSEHHARLGLASSVWPHGRWRLILVGEANHAGTTLMEDRRDPMQVVATAIEGARTVALNLKALATVGKIEVDPNGSNSIPGRVTAWLDLRAPTDTIIDRCVPEWTQLVETAAEAAGVEWQLNCESRSQGVIFDSELTGYIHEWARADSSDLPEVPTGAGHDAAALGARLPTAMIFIRNPSGISHAPAEGADDADSTAGIQLLARVLQRLAS
jgi:beta-ureidopropionase / N-carbamoyl-L-amino-acid hydrolase